MKCLKAKRKMVQPMGDSSQLGNKKFSQIRNRRKIFRTIIQIIILGIILGFAIYNIFYKKSYKPYKDYTQTSDGFIAISYLGVQKTTENEKLITQKLVRKQLTALKKQGYETITSQDIYNYYTKGGKLPEKALYLMVEDGRNDTAIFSKPIIEDLNYKANIFPYAENFLHEDPKFLRPDDLKMLVNSSYWDLGSDGYRLFYINVFDRYNSYLGEISPLMFSMMNKYVIKQYNHYLMDYIRDRYGVPQESTYRMTFRINNDYEQLEKIYMDNIGYVPEVNALMHANTGAFGNNPAVSNLNNKWLKKLFKINFNREGQCLNSSKTNIYDLTRIQVQPWWSTNHLLMRIKSDTNRKVDFVTGNKYKAADWDLIKGACEFVDEKIYLTSLPKTEGVIKLKRSSAYKNFKINVELLGNKKGTQEIFMRSDDKRNNYIALLINGRDLIVKQKYNGTEKELLKENLDKINDIQAVSVDEDKHNVKMREMKVFSLYGASRSFGSSYLNQLKKEKKQKPASVADGAKEYVPEITVKERGRQKLELILQDNVLTIKINNKEFSTQVSDIDAGNIFLRSAWDGKNLPEQNIHDNVYDAVFNQLTVTNIPHGNILFTSEYTGWRKALYELSNYINQIINWFIKYM